MINSDVVNILVFLINMIKKKDGIYYINIKQKTISKNYSYTWRKGNIYGANY